MLRERAWLGLAVAVIKPTAGLLIRREWCGQEHIPHRGGVIVCADHISHADPLSLAHFVRDSGRIPRFLAKAPLFTLPLVGTVLRRHDPRLPAQEGAA